MTCRPSLYLDLLVVVVAACSSSSAPSSVPPRPLYVANRGGNSITAYDSSAMGNATPTIAIVGSNTRLNQPSGVAVDAGGRLYVSTHTDSIVVYAAGATGNATPTATITGSNTGLSQPQAIAFDAVGRLYVANVVINTITVYAAGATGNATPTATITGSNTGLSQPAGIALDAADRIYVSNPASSPSITVYAVGATGNATPTAIIAGGNTGLIGPGAMAFDAAGRLYVANGNSLSLTYNITVYGAGATGNVAPTATIAGSNTGLNGPSSLAFYRKIVGAQHAAPLPNGGLRHRGARERSRALVCARPPRRSGELVSRRS